MARRAKTLEQVEAMQRKAVRFAENVLLDDDKADELEELSPEEYAERKRIRIIMPNPTKDRYMAAATTVTKQELQDTLDEVGTKIAELLNPALSREEIVQQLQELDELVNGSDDDDDDDDEDDDGEEN